jgi:hypothetical protein
MTDTSTQAVEAHIEDRRGWRIEKETSDLLRTLAAERDELVKAAIMQKAFRDAVDAIRALAEKEG